MSPAIFVPWFARERNGYVIHLRSEEFSGHIKIVPIQRGLDYWDCDNYGIFGLNKSGVELFKKTLKKMAF